MQAITPMSQDNALLPNEVLHGSGQDKTRLRNLALANGLALDIPGKISPESHTKQTQFLHPWRGSLPGYKTQPESAHQPSNNPESGRVRRKYKLIIPVHSAGRRGSLPSSGNGSCSPLSREESEVEGLVHSRARHMDHTYKVLVVGDPGVGKTSMVQRYVHGYFTKDYKATLGVDFALKVVRWSDQVSIKLQLWDIAGQERFTSMTRVYYRDAHACVVMFDLTQRSSFHNAAKWKEDLDRKCILADGSPIPCILLANKVDLKHREVEQNEIETFCREKDFVGWSEISVKSGLMVEESMRFLLGHLMESHDSEIDTSNTPPVPSSIALTASSSVTKDNSCPCVLL